MVMVVQSRTSEHGTRRHHTHAEIDARKLTPLLAGAKNGGITVWRITYGLMLITFCFAWWFGWSDEYKKAASIYSTLLLMVALVLGILLGFLVLDVAEKNFRWTGKNVWMFTFLIIWYVSVVSSLGTNEGKRDKNVQQTQLNILETKAGEKLHMLLQKEGLVYAVLLMNGKYPKVKMIDVTEVMFISKADPKPGNKVQESKESKRPGSN